MAPIATSRFPIDAVHAYLAIQRDVRRPRHDEAIFEVETPFARVPVRVCWIEDEDLLTISAFAGQKVPAPRMADAQSLLARYNYAAPSAAWLVLDPEDGEVSARAALPLARRNATADLVRELVNAAVELAGDVLPFLPGVTLPRDSAVPTMQPRRNGGEIN